MISPPTVTVPGSQKGGGVGERILGTPSRRWSARSRCSAIRPTPKSWI